jgi:cytochrome c oxidase subunit 2
MNKVEKVWVVIVVAILILFLSTLIYGVTIGYNPPSSGALCLPADLEKFKAGIIERAPGEYEVNILAKQFSFDPIKIELKNPKKITFRITSPDVIHGFQIVGTNVNVMVFPGYFTIVTWEPPLDAQGEFLIICNEYCGTYHQAMYAKLIILR